MKKLRIKYLVKTWLLIVFGTSLFFTSCYSNSQSNFCKGDEIWYIKHRMELAYDKNDLQKSLALFNELLKSNCEIEPKFIATGIKILHKLNKDKEIYTIVTNSDKKVAEYICDFEWIDSVDFKRLYQYCKKNSELVLKPDLKRRLLKLEFNDQYVRGNIENEFLDKYNLKIEDVLFGNKHEMNKVDSITSAELKRIINNEGFPNREDVGRLGMYAIFIVTQHSNDRNLQKKVLSIFQKNIENSYFDKSIYAYLYDRIKLHERKKQLYGTQISNVDIQNNKVEIYKTQQPELLDFRRKKMGLMPIKIYKETVLWYLKNNN